MTRVYTEAAVFDLTGDQVVLRQTFGTTRDELGSRVGVDLVDPARG